MKKYIPVQEFKAEPMTFGEYIGDLADKTEGYLVIIDNQDGYKRWVPKWSFEKVFREVNDEEAMSTDKSCKNGMTLTEYQERAMTTCMPSSYNFGYMILNLVGEVGELSSKIAKQIRKGNMTIKNCNLEMEDGKYMAVETDEEMKKEAGDILWQLSSLCKVLGWRLEDVAKMNLEKLAARKKAGTIDGSGDGVMRGE